MVAKVLIVEDDRKTIELVKIYLVNDGFDVFTATNGREGLEKVAAHQPDIILLDLMLPGIDGVDVCHKIRAESNVPIIMLTARATEEDKLLGLAIGADDYITKPFSPREVLARVKVVLRRTGFSDGVAEQKIEQGSLVIDLVKHEARIHGAPIQLTPKEFKILKIFARHYDQPFSREALMEKAFGHNYQGLARAIDVHVMNLRKKLAQMPDSSWIIKTVYGVGYKLTEADDV